MNELLKKLTLEVKEKMSEILQSEETRSLIDATKAASDSGNFEVVISTADIDRQGESIKQDGWDLSNYLKNPVVLWGHDYYSLPIAISDSIEVSNGKLIARGHFAPEDANPFAQQVRRLYDAGIVRATSVGFIATEMEGSIITKAELLEFSFVPVPANPYALSLSKAQELRLDLAMIATKGLKLETKAEGDLCTMEDGTEGEMHMGDDGYMECMPKKAIEKSPACRQDGESEDDCRSRKISEMEAEGMEHDQAVAAAIDICKTACEAKQFCAVCAREYPKGSKCLGNLGNIGKNHPEDPDYDGTGGLIIGKEKNAQQIGAILAQLQNIIENAIVNAAKLIIDIVQSEYGQSEAGKAEIAEIIKSTTPFNAIKTAIADAEKKLGIGEGEEHLDGGAPKQRSEAAGVIAAIKDIKPEDLDDYLNARELVRAITKVAQTSLEKMNKRIAENRKRGK